jgi:SAM-dependent methyltransferase
MQAADREQVCPICLDTRRRVIHRQDFRFPGDVRTHYLVNACSGCGFVFATDLPSESEYESYYRTNLRYTYPGGGDSSQALFTMHGRSFEMVDSYLGEVPPRGEKLDTTILDVGCSTGELLALFLRQGYRRLEGLDPAPECREIAKSLHGLEIQTAVLSEFRPGRRFDVVLLANVLEHVSGLRDALDSIRALLENAGLLFVQVPDAENFGREVKEPYLEFSAEHINYFTDGSLANLMSVASFEPVRIAHDQLPYKGVTFPVITSLWRRSGSLTPRIRPTETSAVSAYIEASRARLAELSSVIEPLVKSREPIVVWGVGSLTARLLATTSLAEANIQAFVDSNPDLQGRPLFGRMVHSPSWLAGRSESVLVSSFVYGGEIRAILKGRMAYTGRVVTL